MNVAWCALAAGTVLLLGGRVVRLVLGAFVVARLELGQCQLHIGLLPISGSLVPRFARPDGAASAGRADPATDDGYDLERVPPARRLVTLLLPWLAVLASIAALGGAEAFGSGLRGTWQVLRPFGAAGQGLAAALVAAPGPGPWRGALALAPKVVAFNVVLAVALEVARWLPRRLVHGASTGVMIASLALAAGWAGQILRAAGSR